jgi:hypothetical protein
VKIYCRDRRWQGFSPGWCRLRQRSVHCVTAHYPPRTSCKIHPPYCCLESGAELRADGANPGSKADLNPLCKADRGRLMLGHSLIGLGWAFDV